MKALAAVLMFALVTACGQRQVDVETGPQQASTMSLAVTNNANQAVNVYVVSGGNPIFVGQVSGNSTQTLSVSGVASGSVVSLQARTTDGTKTYTKDNVTLSGSYAWPVP
ncbi:MAG: hypothetical protein H7Z74_12125 [Anaerolineae bacterium]|nr:hypothetical protein [Gemmatimonadaceae bacterium]